MSFSIKKFNTFRLNIYSDYLFIVYNFYDLKKIILFSLKNKKIFIILGEGSNILLIKNFYGIVIINRMKGIKIKKNIDFWFLDIYSGELWSKFVIFLINNGIFGLENLCNIPGTIGSAVLNNIGAYGLELKNFVYYIKIFDVLSKKIFYLKNKDCFFSYRNSILKNFFYNRYIIIKVGLKINRIWKPCLLHKNLFYYFKNNYLKINPINIYIKIYNLRKKNIPDYNIFGNVGSIFKNPEVNYKYFLKFKKKYFNENKKIDFYNNKISAALLIDKCGLKGYTIGDAQIYNKQPLIIINKGYAKPSDIFLLFNYIKKNVFIKFNILLELEIKIINFSKLFNFFNIFKIFYL